MQNIELHADRPHSARVYDYLLGGKDNYPADRAVGEKMLEASPGLRETVRANRRFMLRSARYLAAECGITQFLDIGTGLPTSPNLHEAVQTVDPAARVVYVDNDPIVLVNARALMVGTDEGATGYINADLRDPDAILASGELRKTLDPTRPVAVSLIAILHFVTDDAAAQHIVQRLMAPLPSGSALAISTLTMDGAPHMAGVAGAANTGGIATKLRTRPEVEAFFAGLDLVDPGVVLINKWHPDPQDPAISGTDVPVYGGVAIKP